MLGDKCVSHFASLAKYAVAFLRNSHIELRWQFLEREAEDLGATLKVADDPAAIPFFILGGAGIIIRHAVAQAVVKQDGVRTAEQYSTTVAAG